MFKMSKKGKSSTIEDEEISMLYLKTMDDESTAIQSLNFSKPPSMVHTRSTKFSPNKTLFAIGKASPYLALNRRVEDKGKNIEKFQSELIQQYQEMTPFKRRNISIGLKTSPSIKEDGTSRNRQSQYVK